MTTEDRLKDYILSNYKSIRSFVATIDLPYTTVDGILKRGIENSSLGNVFKICRALSIDADELANGKIVPVVKDSNSERINMLNEKFARLDRAQQDNVLQYIDFLSSNNTT